MPALQPLSNTMAPAAGSSLAHMKSQQLARAEEEKARARRVKGVVVLIEQFLLEQGYLQALQALQQESKVTLTQYTAADNVDLLSIIQSYEEYYEFRSQRKPKLFRVRHSSEEGREGGGGGGESAGERMLARRQRVTDTNTSKSGDSSPREESSPPPPGAAAAADGAPALAKPPAHLRPSNLARALSHSQGNAATADKAVQKKGDTTGLALQGAAAPVQSSIGSTGGTATGTTKSNGPQKDGGKSRGSITIAEEDDANLTHHALKPLPQFPTNELNDLAATILREILDVNPSVRWRDIAALDGAKHLLQEAVVMPVKYPALFQGILRPWKGILLFGPPGTGKTLLAKAVATECRTTFFNISASSVVSKWRGDSEKLVRMLFDLALHYAPSTIFIDEVDSLMSARSSEGEHEGSRRMKTELLTQMDGLAKRRGGDVVFVLAASNVPWDLDTAMLRRLEKRVLVALPSAEARATMFRRLLPSIGPDVAYEACAAMTSGMSGADIDVVCREAMMRPVRKLIEELEVAGDGKDSVARLSHTPLPAPQASLEDVEASLACTRSSVRQEDLARFDAWARDYGSGMST